MLYNIISGKIGMSLDSNWAEPKTNSSKDREAVERYLQTHVSYYFYIKLPDILK